MEASVRPIEWGFAFEPAVPDEPSGDAWLVRARSNGVLVAVLDALGHGPAAADAAMEACDLLAEHADAPLTALLQRCHLALRATRGIAIGLAAFDTARSRLEWISVGNVQGVLVRPGADGRPESVPLLSRGGIVGRSLPLLVPDVFPVRPGDALVMATDGIGPGFADQPLATADPQGLADRLLAHYRRGDDDALTLVARLTGDAT